MAWNAPSTRSTGALITAAIWNADIVDNENALHTGALALTSQAANDIPYASSATQLTRSGSFTFDGTTLTIPGQIKFPATQVASSNANTFDDYEEGTWTGVIGGSGGTSGQSYNNQTSDYIKKGKEVSLWFSLALTAKGTITGNVEIQGLPYLASSANGRATCVIRYFNLAVSWIHVSGWIDVSTQVITVMGRKTAAGTDWENLVTADIGNSTRMDGFISYRAVD